MRAKAIVVLTFLLFTVSSAQAGPQKVLYSFTGGVDGGQPYAGLIFDSAGNLYGVTQYGGAYGQGTVFQLTPSPDGTWTETVLYSFTGGSDGSQPLAGCGKTRFEADGVPRNSLVSTAQSDKKKACVEKTSSSWMFSAT